MFVSTDECSEVDMYIRKYECVFVGTDLYPQVKMCVPKYLFVFVSTDVCSQMVMCSKVRQLHHWAMTTIYDSSDTLA